MKVIHYRSDIDGLRAISILPVILFHLGIPAFSGGYVGVDVFFVISGFLITSIIYGEVKTGDFSFITFYERRIRRIFPALFVVMLVTAAAATWLFLPQDLQAFWRSLAAATLFVANVSFWKEAGYFAASSETKPLLHIWSISVEEQYYIVFPIVVLLLVRYASRHLVTLLSVAAILSFAATVAVVHQHPEAAYFLPVFRAWELLIGALLALDAVPHPRTHLQRDVLSVVGLLLITYGILSFSADTVFPGANALYPCLGAAMLIHAGSGGHPSVVNRLLGWRPFVLLGLMSYSLYLWHWPLIVFARYYAIRELSLPEKLAVMGLALLLAALSWRYIERPFRGKSGLIAGPGLFRVAACAMTVLVAVGLAGYWSGGLPQRMPPQIAQIGWSAAQADPRLKGFDSVSPGVLDHGEAGLLGDPQAPATHYLLWGDSHARALMPGIDDVARKSHQAVWVMGKPGCPPLLGIERLDRPWECAPMNDAVARFIRHHPEIDTVILAARWGLYAIGPFYPVEDKKPVILSSQATSGTSVTKTTLICLSLNILSVLSSPCSKAARFPRTPRGERITGFLSSTG